LLIWTDDSCFFRGNQKNDCVSELCTKPMIMMTETDKNIPTVLILVCFQKLGKKC
jgi:hypothetical protein